MTLYEVHSALARSLGDPFAETSLSTIYDGVRYSKQARQGYLYRACCSIINEVIAQLAAVPREQGAEIISTLFPSLSSKLLVPDPIPNQTESTWNFYASDVNPDGIGIAYLLAVSAYYNEDTDAIPIPIVSSNRARKIASRANRSQLNDPVAWLGINYNYSPTNAFRIYVNQGSADLTGRFLAIYFIRYPLNQVLTDGTLGFDFEASYMNAVLNKATLYGMTDGGDLTPEQILPLLAK